MAASRAAVADRTRPRGRDQPVERISDPDPRGQRPGDIALDWLPRLHFGGWRTPGLRPVIEDALSPRHRARQHVAHHEIASVECDHTRRWNVAFGGSIVSAWAYECRARDDSAVRWFVSRMAIDELPPGTHGVLVRVGDDWVPAVVDRSRQIAVEAMLLRDVIADEEFTGGGAEVEERKD